MNEKLGRTLWCAIAGSLIGVLGILLSGCAGHRLLTGGLPAAYPRGGGEENRTLLFERVYRFDKSGGLTEATHTLVRVGSQGTETALAVYDGSMERLSAFESRVIHAGGAVEWYERGDLGTTSLSNSDVIAERSLRSVPLRDVPRPGDLIETAYEHTLSLPQLGIHFDIAEAGRSTDTVRCTFELPSPDTLSYRALNEPAVPRVTRSGEGATYVFSWTPLGARRKRSAFARINDGPALLAIDPARGPDSWKAFGDWYLGLLDDRLKPDDNVAGTAKRITHPGMTDVEKMNAIAEYCQSHVRYEQVYLDRGEFIPNSAPAVLTRAFGDCKDYSCLIVSMARTLGLDAHPALCHRGVRYEVVDALPVTQFNHMIVNFRSGGKEYWYDGTNQTGVPGVTADDLVNAGALVVEKGSSHMAVIPESADNLLSISGTLHVRGTALTGKLTISLASQYAILLQYVAKYENEGEMRSFLARWLKQEISQLMTVRSLDWASRGGTFQISVGCEFPGSLVEIDGAAYVRLDRVFDELITQEKPDLLRGDSYVYPGYARVALAVDIPECSLEGSAQPFRCDIRYALPPGPFTAASRPLFAEKLESAKGDLARTFKLSRKE